MKINEDWSNFISCIILNQILPLVPIFIEYQSSGHISDKSLALTTSMYAFAIGASSKQKIVFSICLLVGLLTALSFGTIKQNEMASVWSLNSLLIGIVFATHLVERYDRHINDNEVFLLFYKNDPKNDSAD